MEDAGGAARDADADCSGCAVGASVGARARRKPGAGGTECGGAGGSGGGGGRAAGFAGLGSSGNGDHGVGPALCV